MSFQMIKAICVVLIPELRLINHQCLDGVSKFCTISKIMKCCHDVFGDGLWDHFYE